MPMENIALRALKSYRSGYGKSATPDDTTLNTLTLRHNKPHRLATQTLRLHTMRSKAPLFEIHNVPHIRCSRNREVIAT